MKYRCEQRGCGSYTEAFFDGAGDERNCPVCGNPLALTARDGEAPWSDYSVTELRDYAEDWGVTGWNSKTSKADLIALLEAAEA